MNWKEQRENAYPNIILSDCLVIIEFHHDGKITLGYLEGSAARKSEIKYELPILWLKEDPIVEYKGWIWKLS